MSRSLQISKGQWDLWLLNPCTEFVRGWAKGEIERLRDGWESGEFAATFRHEDIIRNATALGACSAYRQLEGLDYEDMTGVRKDVSNVEGTYGGFASIGGDDGNPDGRV